MAARTRRSGSVTAKNVERSLAWLLEPLNRLRRNPARVLSAPATMASLVGKEIADKLTERVKSMGDRAFWADFLSIIPDEAWDGLSRSIEKDYSAARRKIGVTAIGRIALTIVDKAHEVVPFSPVFVLPNPARREIEVATAWGDLIEVRSLRGERRVRLLSQVLAKIAEPLYREHVERLWRLQSYTQRRAPKQPPAFGCIVRELAGSQVSALVQTDAARIRNAVVHGRTEYSPADRVVRLSDHNGWTRSMLGRELLATANQMLRHEAILSAALSEFMQWAIISHLGPPLRGLAAALRTQDDSAIDAIGKQYQERSDALFRTCAKLHREQE